MKGQRDAGLFAAVAGISAVVTAGFHWTEALLGWCLCAILRLILPAREGERGKLASVFLILGGVILAAAVAFAAEEAFPEESTFPFVSLGVMALLWRALIGERETGKRVGSVLGLILLPLLAAVILFGLSDIRWSENLPAALNWKHVWITVAVTSPWWCFGEEHRGWGWFGICAGTCVGMSLLTRGILGSALTEQVGQPLYRAVQTIHVLGVLQRFEALLAAAVLLGSFGMLLLAGELMARGLSVLVPEGRKSWRLGVLTAASFALELALRYCFGPGDSAIMTVFWGLIPIYALWVVFSKKREKTQKRP